MRYTLFGEGKKLVQLKICADFEKGWRRDDQKTVFLKISLHRFIHLKIFWTQFKNRHLQGPCISGSVFQGLTVLQKSKFWNKTFKKELVSWPMFFTEFFLKDSTNFRHWKLTLKIRILKCSRRLLIILVSLTVTLFSEKMLYRYLLKWHAQFEQKNLWRYLLDSSRKKEEDFLLPLNFWSLAEYFCHVLKMNEER